MLRKIITYDLQNREYNLPGTLVSSTTIQLQRAAVDAHYNLGKVYDYFYQKFN
ncbi:bacillolysin [Bacillus amyloliquefaciens]|nr:bacillolysin [Bacillus amyloliquefaciens]